MSKKNKREKTEIVCWNCGHGWKTVRKYTAFCRKCGVVNDVPSRVQEMEGVGPNRAATAIRCAHLTREDLVRYFTAVWYALEDVLECPACSGTGLLEGGELCQCREQVKWIMDTLVGPRFVVIQNEFLRINGHDPDKVGKESARLANRLLAELAQRMGGKTE